MEYEKHLYMICYPNPSLIASQLNPEQFARHYSVGSSRDFEGRIIFAELDPEYRHEYFDIDRAYAELVPHEDGRPKATKFIACYRILEHVEFSAIQKLYLTTPAGYSLYMDPAPYEHQPSSNIIRVYAEINPIRMLVLSRYNYIEFGKYITSPTYPKGAPKIFYTQLEFNIQEFLDEFEANPLMQSPIPGLHPSKIRDAILEVLKIPGKVNKGLAMDCPIDRIPASMIRHGFMFASQEEYKFFPMPDMQTIEKNFYKFYRTMF
jgi:hypothetical protein